MNYKKKNPERILTNNSMTQRIIENQYQAKMKSLKDKSPKLNLNLNSNSLDNYQYKEEGKRIINSIEKEEVKLHSSNKARKKINQQILKLNSFNYSSSLNHILGQKSILKNPHNSTLSPRLYFPSSKGENNSISRIKSPSSGEIVRLKEELKVNEEILHQKELTIKKMKLSIIKLSTRYSGLNSRLEGQQRLKNSNNKDSEKNLTNSKILIQDDMKFKTQKNWNLKDVNSSYFAKEKEKIDKIENLTWIYRGASQKRLKIDKLYLRGQKQKNKIYQNDSKQNSTSINYSFNKSNDEIRINQNQELSNEEFSKEQAMAHQLNQLSLRMRNFFQKINQREVSLVNIVKRILKPNN